MATPKKGKQEPDLTPEEFLQSLADELHRKAREPDLYGYKPLPHQIAFHSSPETGRLAIGGNRSGKSYSNVMEMLWWATGSHPYQETPKPPLRLRHVAVDRPNGIDGILYNLYKRLTPSSFLKYESFEESWRREPPTLFFANGSFIEFRSYEQDTDKHAGASLHAVAFDEEPDQVIFNENLMRLVDTEGKWWCAMTPIEGMSWVFTDIWTPIQEFGEDLAIELFVFPSKDNTYINHDQTERLTRTFTEEEKRVRSDGTFIGLSNLILPFDHKRHVHTDSIPFDPSLPLFCSMDSGLRNPTAWLWIQVTESGQYRVIHEHYEAEMLVEDHARYIQSFESINNWPVIYRIGDPSIAQRSIQTGQSVQSIYADYGIHIGLGSNDVDAGIQRMASLFKANKIIISPSCTNLIRELKLYRWADWGSRKTNANRELKQKPRKKDDHAVDALRYGIMSRPFEDSSLVFNDPANHISNADMAAAQLVPVLTREPGPYFAEQAFSSAFYDPDLGSDW